MDPLAPALIIGSLGQLGGALVSAVSRRGIEAVNVPGPDVLDITDRAAVDDALARHRPAVVLNAAAWTDVDAAERDEAGAELVNCQGPANLARACRRRDTLLVHMSTDYIFDGTASEPYRPDDTPCPINAYGRTKLAGERAVEAESSSFLIVRTSWLFAPRGRNFVRTILKKGRSGDALRVVDDQRGRPTYAPDLADMILALLERGARGVFHAANSGDCTWFELAQAVLEAASASCDLDACNSDDNRRPARRPAYSVLDTTVTDGMIGPARPWRDAVKECVEQLAVEPIA